MPAIVRIVILLACCCATVAQAKQFDDPDPIKLDQAITALSEGSWRARRQAVHDLIRIGPAAQHQLEDLVDSPSSPEVRLRAQEALRQIVPQRRIEPALITRKFVDANVADVFDRVAEIEGAPLRCEPPNLIRNIKHPISVSYDHELYWKVVLDLCRRTGLRLRCDDRGVMIIKAGPRAKFDRFCVNGILLITIPPAIAGSSISKDDVPRLAVYAEPRARLLRGESLKLGERIALGTGEPQTNGFWWPMKRTTSSSIQGAMTVLLAESQHRIEVPGANANSGLSGPMPLNFAAGSVTASVMRVVREQADYHIDIQLSTDPAEVDWNALLFTMRTGGLRVYDVDNRELTFVKFSCEGAGPIDNARLVVSPQPLVPAPATNRPYKLVWDLPTKTVRLGVQFDIEIPRVP